MSLEPKKINGWKWDDLLSFQDARDSLDLAFGLPKVGNITQTAMSEKINYDSDRVLLFYYCGYNWQFVPTLGAASDFDINIDVED